MANYNPSTFPGGALTGAGVDMTNDLIPIWDTSASGVNRSKTITPAELRTIMMMKTYDRLKPAEVQSPASNYATFSTRNGIAVWEFNDSTQQSVVFVSVVPEGAVLGSGLTFRFHCMGATATSGDYVLGVQVERMNTDEDSDSFDTAVEATSTTNATSGIITTTTITVTTIDGAVAGDPIRIKLYRKAADAADTMVGNLQLVVAEMRSAA